MVWDGAKIVVSDAVDPSPSEDYRSVVFSTLTAAPGVTIPDIMKDLLLFPRTSAPKGTFYVRTAGERLPFLGGSRNYSGHAGLGAVYLSDTRANAGSNSGAASAYVEPS
jgi:hypothetical protein